ncbi:replication protein RepA [Salmonella enterica]|nr:replication protein RepA [Salmonella enterica]EBD9523594.1 replication protein RepA [Salmonella enterica]EDX0750250.1 replication protein RepA [Salmonella enterica]EDZ2074320.1 replication protein RepA [Salmonella enterica]EDZ4360320.1 replication protein RepA [Salmonella enterica]
MYGCPDNLYKFGDWKINGVFAFLAPVKPQNQFPAALWRN